MVQMIRLLQFTEEHVNSRPTDALDVRVSGRCLEPIRWLVDRHGLDAETLTEGLELPANVWDQPRDRLSGLDFATRMARVAQQVDSEADLRRAGRALVEEKGLGGLSTMVSTLASPARMYAFAPKLGLSALAPMIEGQYEQLSPTRCRITASVPVGYSPCLLYTSDAADDLTRVPLGGSPFAIPQTHHQITPNTDSF